MKSEGNEKNQRARRRESRKKERKGRERRIRDNIIIFFNYTMLLQYHPTNKMVL